MAKKEKKDGSERLKNPRWELFCVLYAGASTRTYFGNGTLCYLHAFGGEARINEIDEELTVMGELTGSVPDDPEKTYRQLERELKAEKKRIYNSANAASTRLLINVSILKRSNYLLDRYLETEMMDREMAWTIGQRKDLISKVAAYREIAKVKGRTSDKLEGEFSFKWDDGEKPQGTVKVKAKTK